MRSKQWLSTFVLGLTLILPGSLTAFSAPGDLTSSPSRVAARSQFAQIAAPQATDTPTVTVTSTPPPACGLYWRLVASPNPGSYNILYSVAVVSADDVWATDFSFDGSNVHTLIEHWDGSSWSIVASPSPGSHFNFLQSIAVVSASDIWAVGDYSNSSIYQTLIEHWNGATWSIVPSPNQGNGSNSLTGVTATAPNDVWAVGNYSNGTVNQTLTEHWNGSGWSIVSSPNAGSGNNSLSDVLAVAANNVWAVGSAGNQTLTEQWDGSSWSVVPSPSVGSSANALHGLTVIAANDIWAVGAAGGQTLAEHWNGSAWSVIPSADGGAVNELSGVAAVASNDVWAVGYTGVDIAGSVNFAEHWNGSTWSAVPVPNGTAPHNAALWDVAVVSATDVWAVGDDSLTETEHYSDPCSGGTPTSTNTPISLPTNTPGGPTSTPSSATNTPAPPTDTPGGPTATPAPPTTTPTDCPNLFVDVSGNIFYAAIHTLNCGGIVNGTDATHYSPAGTSTRGQFAKVVVLGFAVPLYTPTGGPDFSDVPASYFAYLYIESGYHAAILSGFDQASCQAAGQPYPCYRPNLAITRGQITKLVVNAAHYPYYTPVGGAQDFSDVPPVNVFYVPIETAYHKGVISGYPDHTFRPNNNVRRDEMAQLVFKGITTP